MNKIKKFTSGTRSYELVPFFRNEAETFIETYNLPLHRHYEINSVLEDEGISKDVSFYGLFLSDGKEEKTLIAIIYGLPYTSWLGNGFYYYSRGIVSEHSSRSNLLALELALSLLNREVMRE